MKYVVKEITQTCFACPSQWSGTTEDGKEIYIRYRWGCLSVEINGKEILRGGFGDGLEGLMPFSDLEEITKEILDFSEATWKDV